MTAKASIILLTIIAYSALFSCKENDRKSTQNTNTKWTVDTAEINKYKWSDLIDTVSKVYYIQLNFLNFPDDNYIGKSITDFADSININSHLLDLRQREELLKLVTDTSNFSEGDCGTFHLNAGFIIVEKRNIKASVDIGCGYNQWKFNPFNDKCKYGAFNQNGFRKLETFLDEINSKKPK
jgi:hypothetical protein